MIKFVIGPAIFATLGYFMATHFHSDNQIIWAAMGAAIWYAGLLIIYGGAFIGDLLEGIGDILD